MRAGLRIGALTLALVGALGFAVHDKLASRQVALVEAPGIDDDDEITGSIDKAAALGLSEEQRGLIFLGVINLPDVPDVIVPALWPTAALPDSVELYELPAMVTSKIPPVKEMRFVKLDDRILLVRPTDRMVVAVIPRYRVWQ
jgi:hypothetical protein